MLRHLVKELVSKLNVFKNEKLINSSRFFVRQTSSGVVDTVKLAMVLKRRHKKVG